MKSYNFWIWVAITFNVLFIEWMIYNGIDEARLFVATIPEIISYIILMFVLCLNSYLLYKALGLYSKSNQK